MKLNTRYTWICTIVYKILCCVFAARNCPAPFVYDECVSKCPMTCNTMYNIPSFECMQNCYPGCRCPTGTFLSNNTCVTADECPCHYMRIQYANKDVKKIGCRDW